MLKNIKNIFRFVSKFDIFGVLNPTFYSGD